MHVTQQQERVTNAAATHTHTPTLISSGACYAGLLDYLPPDNDNNTVVHATVAIKEAAVSAWCWLLPQRR